MRFLHEDCENFTYSGVGRQVVALEWRQETNRSRVVLGVVLGVFKSDSLSDSLSDQNGPKRIKLWNPQTQVTQGTIARSSACHTAGKMERKPWDLQTCSRMYTVYIIY